MDMGGGSISRGGYGRRRGYDVELEEREEGKGGKEGRGRIQGRGT